MHKAILIGNILVKGCKELKRKRVEAIPLHLQALEALLILLIVAYFHDKNMQRRRYRGDDMMPCM